MGLRQATHTRSPKFVPGHRSAVGLTPANGAAGCPPPPRLIRVDASAAVGDATVAAVGAAVTAFDVGAAAAAVSAIAAAAVRAAVVAVAAAVDCTSNLNQGREHWFDPSTRPYVSSGQP